MAKEKNQEAEVPQVEAEAVAEVPQVEAEAVAQAPAFTITTVRDAEAVVETSGKNVKVEFQSMHGGKDGKAKDYSFAVTQR